ncbi:hypothetical protein E2562_016264 [Oryza meyeriana var. granulata]|uniref:Uncharacterized protein n=1 Tax=Oryza meyeriana var. granulata TaxID=110450 RepID=A0A6G1CQN3_9ORYZ|nr:hypothetical protein E2562_016264 [Oryza meyeriana var. granulata]
MLWMAAPLMVALPGHGYGILHGEEDKDEGRGGGRRGAAMLLLRVAAAIVVLIRSVCCWFEVQLNDFILRKISEISLADGEALAGGEALHHLLGPDPRRIEKVAGDLHDAVAVHGWKPAAALADGAGDLLQVR